MINRALLKDLRKIEDQRFLDAHPKSGELFTKAKESMPNGVPMSWMSKWPGAYPVFVEEAKGASFVDVDGNTYIDFCLGDTGSMTGHSPEPTVAAIREQTQAGPGGFNWARCPRWPSLAQTLAPCAPISACRRLARGRRSQDCGSKRSPPSWNWPSSSKNSPPSGNGSSTRAPAAHNSKRTSSCASLNSGETCTPGRVASLTRASLPACSRTWVRSCRSNCQSLTKRVVPSAEPGVCRDCGGLRM